MFICKGYIVYEHNLIIFLPNTIYICIVKNNVGHITNTNEKGLFN